MIGNWTRLAQILNNLRVASLFKTQFIYLTSMKVLFVKDDEQ